MGFVTDPYRVFTTFACSATGNKLKIDNADIYYRWACSSCGLHSPIIFDGETPLNLIHADFILHVKFNHRIKLEDTKDWALGI